MGRRRIVAADLFAGAGGTSTGLIQAAEQLGLSVDLVAVNHWETAVETHAQNHPGANHLCASLDRLDPSKVVPGRRLDLLVASPECVHFSSARGGRPMDDQSRASAWHVLHWAERLRVERILVENVREFLTWGPLGANGRPLKRRRGETFRAFVQALESLGYRVEWRVLNCADHGDATTRQRLFIMARRGHRSPAWPTQSHAKATDPTLFAGDLLPWRPARDVIDWSLPSESIFGRKRPLAESTIRRIVAGLRRFGGPAVEPFLLQITHGGRVHDLDRPMPTITGGNRGDFALCEPFVLAPLGISRGNAPRHVGQPMPTCTASRGGGHLVEPFLVSYYGTGGARSLDEPVRTLTAKSRFGLVEPVALDIRFRMLQPHELAAAMSFPSGYRFAGTKTDAIRQIGNAVPVSTARALCSAMLQEAA